MVTSMKNSSIEINWHEKSLEEIHYFSNSSSQRSKEDFTNAISDYTHLTHEFFIHLTKKLKIKSEWESYLDLSTDRTGIEEIPVKTRGAISLGVEANGFYLQTTIRYEDRIYSMTREFWDCIMGLERLGECTLFDNQGNQKGNSLVYQLAHAQICSSLEKATGQVIWIELKTDQNADFNSVMRFYERGIKNMYRANYLLYRSYYLIRKSQEQQIKKKYGQKVKLV